MNQGSREIEFLKANHIEKKGRKEKRINWVQRARGAWGQRNHQKVEKGDSLKISSKDLRCIK